MSWHAHCGRRSKESGKFRVRSGHGTVKTVGAEYRGWSYSFVAHQSGSSVARTRYSVSILDANKNRAHYMRGFASIKQATTAAQEWIDAALGRILRSQRGGQV